MITDFGKYVLTPEDDWAEIYDACTDRGMVQYMTMLKPSHKYFNEVGHSYKTADGLQTGDTVRLNSGVLGVVTVEDGEARIEPDMLFGVGKIDEKKMRPVCGQYILFRAGFYDTGKPSDNPEHKRKLKSYKPGYLLDMQSSREIRPLHCLTYPAVVGAIAWKYGKEAALRFPSAEQLSRAYRAQIRRGDVERAVNGYLEFAPGL